MKITVCAFFSQAGGDQNSALMIKYQTYCVDRHIKRLFHSISFGTFAFGTINEKANQSVIDF